MGAACIALAASAALAQPKRRPSKAATPPAPSDTAPPARSAEGEPDKKNGKPAAAAENASDSVAAEADSEDDLGPAPKPSTANSAVRTSPLNPAANEFPQGEAVVSPAALDRLLADIASLRGRIAALTRTLFKSKLRISVESESEHARISRLLVTVDDGVVYTAPERFTADEAVVVFEHAVAPGHHVVGIEIERYDARNRQFQTWQSSKFSVVVPEAKLLSAEIQIEDDSDMAEDFPSDESGEYALDVRLQASVAD
jgi:hypothetical protein